MVDQERDRRASRRQFLGGVGIPRRRASRGAISALNATRGPASRVRAIRLVLVVGAPVALALPASAGGVCLLGRTTASVLGRRSAARTWTAPAPARATSPPASRARGHCHTRVRRRRLCGSTGRGGQSDRSNCKLARAARREPQKWRNADRFDRQRRSALNMTSGTSPPLDAQRDRHRRDRRFHSDSRASSDNVVTWRFRPEYLEQIAVRGSGRRSEWRTTNRTRPEPKGAFMIHDS